MTKFLEDLAARRRFGMKPGLDTIRSVAAALGDPQLAFKAIHVAGTNGKGAVAALLDAALREAGERTGRYTSPHLVRLNERFVLDGLPLDDATLERAAEKVEAAIRASEDPAVNELTFFEALTAVAFLVYAEARCGHVVLECGLGGRLDATNVCTPELCVITKIGLDHCDWLGDTVEKIAAEKAGIIKPGVPVVLARNVPEVRAVVEARAKELGAPFFYAPELADESEIPADFPLAGSFNRENAVTALAALKVLGDILRRDSTFYIRSSSFSRVLWPGRFQRLGDVLIDGAHNPPAAEALATALRAEDWRDLTLIAGFCGDKDTDVVLRLLAPFVTRGYAVKTVNPRSLSAEETARRMSAAGIASDPAPSFAEALARARKLKSSNLKSNNHTSPSILVAGSLFLAGEAVVELGGYPWSGETRFDPSEKLVAEEFKQKGETK